MPCRAIELFILKATLSQNRTRPEVDRLAWEGVEWVTYERKRYRSLPAGGFRKILGEEVDIHERDEAALVLSCRHRGAQCKV